MNCTLLLLLLLTSPAAPKAPQDLTEQDKTMALKLGYVLNGHSMVKWGAIDLVDPMTCIANERLFPVEAKQ